MTQFCKKFQSKAIRSNALAVREDEQTENGFVRLNEQAVRSNEQEEIRRLFRMSGEPAKVWVDKIQGVKLGDRYFQLMMSGEREIPPTLIKQLRKIGDGFLMERKTAIDEYFYERILESYGPAGQNMIDNGGADY